MKFCILSTIIYLIGCVSATSQTFEAKYYSPVKMMSESSKSLMPSEYTLYFNKIESVFLLHASERQAVYDENAFAVQMSFGNPEMWFFKDFQASKLISKQSAISDKFYIINDSLHPMKWKLQNETRKIGDFSCRKAQCLFRGRNYTAWYTSDIAVSNGPWKMGGLPGLILEVYDESKEVAFLFQSFRTLEVKDIPFQLPESVDGSEKEISPEEYYELSKHEFEKYMSFMQGKAKRLNPEFEIKVDLYKPWEIFEH